MPATNWRSCRRASSSVARSPSPAPRPTPTSRCSATRPPSAGWAWKRIHYAYEPVGAAFFFARTLTEDATVLVGDFGGGTSDFSVIRFERSGGTLRATPLGRSGVGVAGDAFDYRIIDQLVSPQPGKGSSYASFGKISADPQPLLFAFARWDQLALIAASKDMREIRKLAREATEPEKIERLVKV